MMAEDNPFEPPQKRSRSSRRITPLRMQFSLVRLFPLVIVCAFIGGDAADEFAYYLGPAAGIYCLLGGALIGLLVYFALELLSAIVRSLRGK